MGANGSFASGITKTESGRRYKTMFSLGDNIKILEPKRCGESVKLPEESHTPNRIYATFYADGHDVKCIAQYDSDGKKRYEIHTVDHRGLGEHYHVWKDGRPQPDGVYKLTPDMRQLLNKIRDFDKS